MVTTINNFKKFINTIRLAIIILFASTSTALAQAGTAEEFKLPESAVANYLTGMQSDNPGLKASSVYFAGKYKISEASEKLIRIINSSDDLEFNKLAAWSLYRIGNDCCVKELEKIAEKHPSERLRSFCSNLHQLKKFELAVLSEHPNR